MNTFIQRHLAEHQLGGEDWPPQALFAAKYNLSTWPLGWTKEASVAFFMTLDELTAFLAQKAEWAKYEDNYTAIAVYEWELGPVLRTDLSMNVSQVGKTYKEQLQPKVIFPTQEEPKAPKSSPNATFVRLLGMAKQVEFNERWVDRSGDLGNATNGSASPRLDCGELLASQDYLGRAVLIIGLGYGNKVVLRQRSKRDPMNGIVFADAPGALVDELLESHELHLDGIITEHHMKMICALIVKNIPRSVDNFDELARVLVP